MTAEQKELIEEKFQGVHALIQANFDVVNLELRHIKEQTTRTNGRVTRLEDESSNCPNLIDLKSRVREIEQWKWRNIGIGIAISSIFGGSIALLTLYLMT